MRRNSLTYVSMLRLGSVMIAAITGLAISPRAFAASELAPPARYPVEQSESFVVADAHTYRHCHKLPKRTYCHKQDRLPQNWPPHTDTPHSGERTAKAPCQRDGKNCRPGQIYKQR